MDAFQVDIREYITNMYIMNTMIPDIYFSEDGGNRPQSFVKRQALNLFMRASYKDAVQSTLRERMTNKEKGDLEERRSELLVSCLA